MDWISDPHIWLSLLTLTALEIVLGIDNVIFISILAGKLPPEEQDRARKLGLMLALVTRIALLCTLFIMIRLTQPLFTMFNHGFSGRDLVLIAGGLFLLAKATHEIHDKLEGAEGEKSMRVQATMGAVIFQILVLDIVFSLDSVITAVGMADRIGVMIAAVILSMLVMLASSGGIMRFVDKHPTVKMLALSFLLLIGVVLVADGFGQHIPKGYIYFALAFSVGVEMLNIKMRVRREPVTLHQPYR